MASQRIGSVIASGAAFLILPFLLLNTFGAIVGGIWMAVLGEWVKVVVGILVLIAGTFIIGLALLPQMLFGVPAIKAFESGKKPLAGFLCSLNVLYLSLVIGAWCIASLTFFTDSVEGVARIPALLWSYAIALGPWQYLARKEPGALADSIAFGAQACYVVVCIMFLAGAESGTILTVFVSLLLAIGVLQVWSAMAALSRTQSTLN